VVAAFWLVSLSVAGQEATPGETAPTQPEAAVAPAPVGNQILESEFELLQEPIIESASKRSESVFESPFSADVITRDIIQKSGARTIPEALRLLPGMLVYEQSSGNFDIHIRGFDNIQPGGMLQDFPSTTMLVMIDYRVVYNYLQGGTFWECLPVDIIDVERIELVRGPVAALYGPNAVTGVINIITRKYISDGPHANVQAEGALSTGDSKWKNDFTLGQYSASGRVGYKYKTISGGLSANYHSYNRLEDGLYSFNLQRRVAHPQELQSFMSPYDYLSEPKVTYPDPGLAYRTVGSTGFFTYEPTEKLSFILNGGYQESRTLREYIEAPFSPFNTHDGQSWYLDLRSHFYNFTFQASFNTGHQMVPGNKSLLPDNSSRERYEYKFNTLDLNLDYDFIWEWLRVRPGVSFRRAQYSGLPFATWEHSTVDNTWQENGETKAIQSASASVGLEQTLWKRLRLIEAVRLDMYFDRTEDNYYEIGSSSPTTRHGRRFYPAYQVAVTYTPADNHILRASFARASKSPSMVESFYNDMPLSVGGMKGNNSLNLLTFDTVELGYRTRFNQQMDLSIEVFGTHAFDFSNMYYHAIDFSQNPIKIIFQYDNLNLEAWQLGSTISVGYTSHRFQGRVFATVQQTRLDHLARNIFHIFDISYNPLDPKNQIDTPHVGSPDVFGGFYLNYQPADKWNINLNAYFFTQRTQIHNDLPTTPDYTPAQADIQQSFLLNAKVSYNVWNGLMVYVNVRNLFNINQNQFIWGDANHILCFIGLQYDL
jgi:Outer membrane receptor proteins, mostly Fe transport